MKEQRGGPFVPLTAEHRPPHSAPMSMMAIPRPRRLTPRRTRRWTRRHPVLAGSALVLGAVSLAVAGDAAIGARASFLLETAIAVGLTLVLGAAARTLVRSSADPRLSRLNRRIVLVIAVLPAFGAAFAGLQAAELAADAVLPFDRIDTIVLEYRPGTGGRFPSHARIVTEAGTFDLPYLDPSPQGPIQGGHVVVVTHFERLVMAILPPGR